MAIPGGNQQAQRNTLYSLLWVAVILFGLSLIVDKDFLAPIVNGWCLARENVRALHEHERKVQANQALEAQIKFLQTDKGAQWAAMRYRNVLLPSQEIGIVQEAVAAPPPPVSGCKRLAAWGNQMAQRVHEWWETVCYFFSSGR